MHTGQELWRTALKILTGCPGYFSPFLKGYNLANNQLRAKILACECDLWAAILFETKKNFENFEKTALFPKNVQRWRYLSCQLV